LALLPIGFSLWLCAAALLLLAWCVGEREREGRGRRGRLGWPLAS
jgi:hypothetical protein